LGDRRIVGSDRRLAVVVLGADAAEEHFVKGSITPLDIDHVSVVS
jgi:hypothetical protein